MNPYLIGGAALALIGSHLAVYKWGGAVERAETNKQVIEAQTRLIEQQSEAARGDILAIRAENARLASIIQGSRFDAAPDINCYTDDQYNRLLLAHEKIWANSGLRTGRELDGRE